MSDVANAVLDGADCVMLSGETAKGKYPEAAVAMMAETCLLAEATICYPPLFNELRVLQQKPTTTTETVAMAAVAASLEQNAGAILVMSTSGNTARLVSKYRPACPILTMTRDRTTSRQIHLHRGCYPFYYNEERPNTDEGWQTDVDNRIRYGLREALKLGILKRGDTVVAIQGWRSGGNHTNVSGLHRSSPSVLEPCHRRCASCRCRKTTRTSSSASVFPFSCPPHVAHPLLPARQLKWCVGRPESLASKICIEVPMPSQLIGPIGVCQALGPFAYR